MPAGKWERVALPLSRTAIIRALPRSLHRAARTKEQSQRRVLNLLTRMAYHGRRAYKDRHARISSWPGELLSNRRPNTFCADLSSRPRFPLQSRGGPYILVRIARIMNPLRSCGIALTISIFFSTLCWGQRQFGTVRFEPYAFKASDRIVPAKQNS